jgi:catechol 2,3-dioxygenase-like lactoylglutathione lyase family enzyme
MKINHLIVGSSDVEKSVAFYCNLFGFKKVSDNPGANGGQVLHGIESDLLILPFKTNLPNPTHFAFEVDDVDKFKEIFARAEGMGLEPRTEPRRDSKRGFGEFNRASRLFLNFYVSDPSGSNVELMVFI